MYSSDHFAKSLYELQKQTKDPSKLVDDFCAFMQKNHLTAQLPGILSRLEIMQKKDQDENTIIIESPFEISDELQEVITKQYDTQPDTQVKQIINKNLLGGYRAIYKGNVIDASQKTLLTRLKQHINTYE